MSPFFSIIIPLYNKENYIAETIQSVLNQSYTNFEIIIVNDGSTDNSVSVIKKFTDNRIFIYNHTKNKGLSATRNIGIANAKGTIICLLDADDVWENKYLSSIYTLSNLFPEINFYGTDYVELYNFGQVGTNKTLPKHLKGNNFIVDNFFKSNLGQPIICPSSIAFKKTVFDTTEIFDTTIKYAEDIDFYIRIFTKHPLAYSYNSLVIHKCDIPNQMTTTGKLAHKIFPDFNKYTLLAKNNTALQKYIDFYRYCFAIDLRLEGSKEKATYLIKAINFTNINRKQQLLLQLPVPILRIVKNFKKLMLKRKIKLSSY